MLVKLQAYSVQATNLQQIDCTIDLFQKQTVLKGLFEKEVFGVPAFK